MLTRGEASAPCNQPGSAQALIGAQRGSGNTLGSTGRLRRRRSCRTTQAGGRAALGQPSHLHPMEVLRAPCWGATPLSDHACDAPDNQRVTLPCPPPRRFITYEDEAAVDRVFAKGRMHELAGKSVEVKRATPKGSGPAFGRGVPMQRWGPGPLCLLVRWHVHQPGLAQA